jgi:hypothetical protein
VVVTVITPVTKRRSLILGGGRQPRDATSKGDIVPLVLTYDGQCELCDQWTDQLYAQCHLYVNDVTPSAGLTLGDLVEASFPGYQVQNVSGWTPSEIFSGNAITYADPLAFRCTGGGALQLVYGYFITRGSPGRLIWAELRAAGPISMHLATDVASVLPSLTLSPS